MDKKHFKKGDLIIITVIAVIAIISGLYYMKATSKPASYAEINVAGKVVETLDLSKDTEFILHTPEGTISNHLIVKDGEIWCEEASCPDKICISQGHQSKSGGVIVCLPNKLIVTVVEK